ncbi:MAG: insulinase family protein [Planctomycetales bacterium]|nr:insulinase family protein [Planctomycetales bacterium]
MTVPQQLFAETLDNGMVLVGERMDWVESAAMSALLPSGGRTDPLDRPGLSNLLCDMVQRGAGSRDTRQLLNDLENLGVSYGGQVSNAHMSFGAAMLADRLFEALPIFADIICRPHLPESQLDDSRSVCYQEIRAIDDEPARQLMMALRRQHYPAPLGNDPHGTLESVGSITYDDVREHWRRQFVPRGTILSIAGRFDWPQLVDQVRAQFGDWQGSPPASIETTAAPGGYLHIPHESNQTHIGIAYASLPADHPDFYRAWAGVSILGDGESSRLFTQLREKHGLVYTYSANYHTVKSHSSIQCYAGTMKDAQKTLDVMLHEIQLLSSDGVTPEEVDRLKTRCKTLFIMNQESSRARAGALASQWHLLGRLRPLAETEAEIDALSCETIGEYLRANPPASYTFCTLGPKPLETSVEVS